MDRKARKKAPTWVVLLLTITLVLPMNGCLLLDKIIIDTYVAVFGVPVNTAARIWLFQNLLAGDDCLPTNSIVEIQAKLTQSLVGPVLLILSLEYFASLSPPAAPDTEAFEPRTKIGEQTFQVQGKAGKKGSNFPNQKFSLNFDSINPIFL